MTKSIVSNKFPKYERLKLRRHFKSLYQKGEVLKTSILKAVFLIEPYQFNQFPIEYWIKAGFSVPKRKLKKAVLRNKIRRRIREAYRLNRNPLKQKLKQASLSLKILFIYRLNEVTSYHAIEKDMKTLLKSLIQRIDALPLE